VTNIQPEQKTIGTDIDSWIADLHARLSKLELAEEAKAAKVKTWIIANWPHAVTWLMASLTALKVFGKL
jgi:hypothetical protein